MRAAIVAFLLSITLPGEVPTLPPLREQAQIQQEWLRLRLERHVPVLMRKHGAQMWIVACREYAEDPAFFSVVSPTVFAARRTTIYVFYDRGPNQPLERLALGGDSNGTALRLNTDTQHMGYVLRDGETAVPAGIQAALKNTNRLQDLTLERMHPGRTGNEVLADVLHAMHEAKIEGSVYTHPIGDHGHAAGPLIGLWDLQQGVPGRGDVPLLAGSWFSIELQATTPVPEWDGQKLQVAQEEDAVLDEHGKMSWVLNRQTEYHLFK